MPDTMKIADELNAAGIGDQQARAIARMQAQASEEYATKDDVALLTERVNIVMERLDVFSGRMDALDKWMKFSVGVMAAMFLKIFLD